MIGILYPNCSNSAYSACRVWIALGFAIGFITAELMSVQARLWILLGTILLAVLCYIIIELTTQTKSSLLSCFYSYKHCRNKKELDQTSTDNEAKNGSSDSFERSSQPDTTMPNTGSRDTQESTNEDGHIFQDCESSTKQFPNSVPTYECDSLDGIFPSWSTESNIC